MRKRGFFVKCLLVIILGIVSSLWLLVPTTENAIDKPQPVTVRRIPIPPDSKVSIAVSESGSETLFLHDRSPTGKCLLISKVRSENPDAVAADDLWFQDAAGRKRLVAREVIQARFSPDGSKIAYTTSAHAMLIETVEGEHLAEVPRACDPNWQSESNITFSAIPDLDYPEFKQGAVYDLHSGQVLQLTDGN